MKSSRSLARAIVVLTLIASITTLWADPFWQHLTQPSIPTPVPQAGIAATV